MRLAIYLPPRTMIGLPPPPPQPGVLPAEAECESWISALEQEAALSTILIVDAAEINRRLLRGMLKATSYRVREAVGAAEALPILEREKVDLVIVDLMIPGMNALEFCRRVKANRKTHLVPILILTSVQGSENEVAAISSGADEFLFKPLHPDVLRARVRSMLRNKAAVDSLEEAESILLALAQTVEQRDHYTGGHCQRLAAYSLALGTALGLGRRELQALRRGAYLHDIGKIAVPDSVLFKQEPLDEDEWVLMQQHTVRGEEICRPMRSLVPVLPIIRSHHERWDGSGYPDQLAGEEIPLLARVIQIVDIYDALTTVRPYKPSLTHEEALLRLDTETTWGWRDPELVSLFREVSTRLLVSSPLEEAEAEVGWMHSVFTNASLENMRRELLK